MKYNDSALFTMLPDSSGYMVAFWELEPVTPEWTPTGRITVFLQDKGHHRLIYMELDNEANWQASGDCEGVPQETIDWLGSEIEHHFE